MSELNKYSLKQFFLNNFDAIINAKIWQNVLMRTVALTLCLGFLYFVVSIDLTLYQQLAFGLLSIIVAIKLNNARWKSYGLIALFAILNTNDVSSVSSRGIKSKRVVLLIFVLLNISKKVILCLLSS